MVKPAQKKTPSSAAADETKPLPVPDDPVEEASEESFPASDSPAWIGGHDVPHDSTDKK